MSRSIETLTGSAVAARVLEHGLEDPLGQLGSTPIRTASRGGGDLQLDLALRRQGRACAGRFGGDRVGVGGAALAPASWRAAATSASTVRVSCAAFRWIELERVAVLARRPLAAQRELGLGEHAGERRPQLVRELGGEALLVAEARGEPVEQAVERRGELGQLVVRLAEREAAVEVVLAPGRGLAVIACDRPQRRAEQPAAASATSDEHERAEDERGDQRDPPRLLVGRERDAGDDGADAARRSRTTGAA